MSGETRPASGEAIGVEPVSPPASESAVIPGEGAAGQAATIETGAIETGAIETGAIAPAPAAPPATAPSVAADAPPAISTARRRLLVLRAGLGRVLRFALVLAIFIGGVAFGYRAFLASQPAPSAPFSDAATAGNQASPVVREFIAAVATNDADAVRSAVPAGPYKLFTYEMERWEFQEVTSVDTLATYEDGTRTSTAFVMVGRDPSNNPIAINLIVETQDGNIVGFK